MSAYEHAFSQCTNLLVLQECLTHAGAEVQLSLQLADLFLPLTRALCEGELGGPAQVLLSPRGSVLARRRLVQSSRLLLLLLLLLLLIGLSLVMKGWVPTTFT